MEDGMRAADTGLIAGSPEGPPGGMQKEFE